jgi:hypothetical protein
MIKAGINKLGFLKLFFFLNALVCLIKVEADINSFSSYYEVQPQTEVELITADLSVDYHLSILYTNPNLILSNETPILEAINHRETLLYYNNYISRKLKSPDLSFKKNNNGISKMFRCFSRHQSSIDDPPAIA